MRRLLGVSAAVIACLALGGMPARSQDASPDTSPEGPTLVTATYVTGTQTFIEDVVPPSTTTVDGVEQIREAFATYDFKMSDPRVSGTFKTLGVAMDVYPDGLYVVQGPGRLENAAGAWAGSMSGAYEPTMGWQVFGWLAGEGDYEGLTFYCHWSSADLGDGVWEVDGVVFAGSPPLVP